MIHSFLLIGQSNMAGRGFVSAEGLQPNPDNLHFCAKALREFGLRYYQEFKKLEVADKIFVDKPDMDDALRTEMEKL